MKKITFADLWEKTFADFGFTSFDDFFNCPATAPIGKKTKRNVSRLTLGDGRNGKEFFIKRFYHSHYKDAVWTWLNFGRPVSQAAVEWNNAHLLLRYGFGTYLPVCFGEQIKWGLEKKSFVVTEKLKSQNLPDFIAENWTQLSQSEKEKIITSLAKLIRKIHDAGINLPDLYIWHIFIKEKTDEEHYDFDIIDLHRMTHGTTNENRQIKNLGRLDYSMLDKYFDENLRRLFLGAYAGHYWPASQDHLFRKVRKYSAALSSKRKQKRY